MSRTLDSRVRDEHQSPWPWVAALALLALAARVAAVLILADRHTAYYEYMLIARNLLRGLGYSYDDDGAMPMQPTSLFPPGYVYWCAAFMRISPHDYLPLYLAQAIVGASGVFPAYLAGSGFFGGRAGLCFAGAYAVFPEMIVLAVRPVPECLYVVVFLWLLVLYVRMKAGLPTFRNLSGIAVVFGITAGLGMLFRATVALQVLAILVALLMLTKWRLNILIRKVWPAALVMLLILVPWVIRNWNVQHRWIPLRTGLGQNLWIGNNPVSDGSLWMADGRKARFALPPQSEFYSRMPVDEQDRDDYYLRQAISYIRGHPWTYLRLCTNRLIFFLWFDAHHPLARNVIYRVCYVVVLIAAAAGVYLSVRSHRLDPVLPVTYLLYLLFYVPILSAPRYRIVPVVVLLLLASYAAATWRERWQARRIPSHPTT